MQTTEAASSWKIITKLAICLIFLLPLISCGTSQKNSNDGETISLIKLAHENQTNINKLSIGMSKSTIFELMGDKTAKTGDGLVSNPFRSETFQDKSGAQYEVLYFVTEKNRAFQPLKLTQTTPLIIKNGGLIGWGKEALIRAKELISKEINISIDH